MHRIIQKMGSKTPTACLPRSFPELCRFSEEHPEFRSFLSTISNRASGVATEMKNHDEKPVDESPRPHVPVMAKEVIRILDPKPGQVFIDMTFGAGGHTQCILNSADDTIVYALDRDPVAFDYAKAIAKKYNNRVIPLLGRFSEMDSILRKQGVQKESIDGILLDVGISSMQLDQAARGFSIKRDEPLDMRMDGNRFPDHPTACDVVNTLDEKSLERVIKIYGEEKLSKPIARAIVEARYMLRNVTTTGELAAIVEEVAQSPIRLDKLQRPTHVATKTFQALRIFVNDELNQLNHGIEVAYNYLKPATLGKLICISFHSLEDRIVKRHFLGIDMDESINMKLHHKFRSSGTSHEMEVIESLYNNKWKQLTKHVLVPTEAEVNSNPRSRSAKLRAAVKC